MASPQTENGYTPIANEILDHMLKRPLNGTQWRILLTVWRYTYGFSRKDHSLAVEFIRKATGCCKRQIQRELDWLISANILIVTNPPTFVSARRIAFNKDYETYQLASDNTSIHQVSNPTPVGDLDTSGANRHQGANPTPSQVSNMSPHQVSNQTPKKTNIKTNIKTMHDDEFECFYAQYPNPKERQRTFTNWCKAIKEHKPDELIQAAQNYAKTVEGTERKYIKTSANFLGRDKPYLDYLGQPKEVAPAKRELKPIMFDLADPDAYHKLYGGADDGH